MFPGSVHQLPKEVKVFTAFFLIALSFGFFTGFSFLRATTNLTPAGIEENYLGNENFETADENTEMLFKKSEREILTIIHTHVLSLSLIFLVLGGMIWFCDISPIIKKFLMIEPMLSLIFTFGGIWVMWKGTLWFKYVVMISGILMVFSFCAAVILIFLQLLRKRA